MNSLVVLFILFFGLYPVTACSSVSIDDGIAHAPIPAKAVEHIGWGGGGAFTSVVMYKGDTYISSDVAGVWRLDNDSWIPTVNGLEDYNVTSLAVHGENLLAISSSGLFTLDDDKTWVSLNISINTKRNTSKQVYSVANDDSICVSDLKAKLVCINGRTIEEHQYELSRLHGIHFDKGQNNDVYGFADKNLYRLNTQDQTYQLINTFDSKILRIVTVSEDSMQLVVTETAIYKLGDLSKLGINTDQKIINVLVSEHGETSQNFIALGSQWNTKLHYLTYENNALVVGDRVGISYDESLPFRKWRKSITMPLGTPIMVGDNMWFADYWGVYKYSQNAKRFEEYSLDASNFVGTDIELDGDTLFIASMDNGIVSTPQFSFSDQRFNSVFPRTGTDWRMAGHVWSIKHQQGEVYATISPWNQASDFVLAFDENEEVKWAQQLGEYTNRRDEKAFWGNGYSRQLVLGDSDIFTVRDGKTGGLFKIADYQNKTSDEQTQNAPIAALRQDENNRVFRGLVVFENQLVSYHIEEQNTLRFSDMETGEVTSTILLPSNLWVFELKTINNSLYLLGDQGKPVIYQLKDGSIKAVLTRDQSSSFLAFNANPSGSLMFASTVNWSSKKDAEVLMSADQGDNWKDISCLMENRSGAVDIEFDEWGEYAYVLMHVGGVMKLDVWFLEGFDGC